MVSLESPCVILQVRRHWEKEVMENEEEGNSAKEIEGEYAKI